MSNDERARKVYYALVGVKPATRDDRRYGWCKACSRKYANTDAKRLDTAEHKPTCAYKGYLYCASCIEKVIRSCK